MIPAEAILRVFPIRYARKQGTCFSIKEKNQEFLVTAAHIIEGYEEGGELHIGCESEDDERRVWGRPRLLIRDEQHDIAILDAPKCTHRPHLTLESRKEGIVFGQKVQWMGYPLGLDGGMLTSESGAPVAIASTGTLAGMNTPLVLGPRRRGFLVEGVINKGYSGGPILFREWERPENKIYVVGVISGSLAAKTNWGLIIAGDLPEVMGKIHRKTQEVEAG